MKTSINQIRKGSKSKTEFLNTYLTTEGLKNSVLDFLQTSQIVDKSKTTYQVKINKTDYAQFGAAKKRTISFSEKMKIYAIAEMWSYSGKRYSFVIVNSELTNKSYAIAIKAISSQSTKPSSKPSSKTNSTSNKSSKGNKGNYSNTTDNYKDENKEQSNIEIPDFVKNMSKQEKIIGGVALAILLLS